MLQESCLKKELCVPNAWSKREEERKKKKKFYFNDQLHFIRMHFKNTWRSWLLRGKSEDQICLYTLFPFETKLT